MGEQMRDPVGFDDDFAVVCGMDGPLNARLAALTDIIEKHSSEFSSAYDELVAQLRVSEAGNGAPTVGDTFPPFMLSDSTGKLVRLEDLLAAGPIVISFNRGHWCEYCELELRSFTAALSEFARHGAKVVCIMPDRIEYIRKVRERSNDTCLVLCDMDSSYAMELNLVIWLGDRVLQLLAGMGLSLDVVQGNKSGFVPIPATYVLNNKGIVIGRNVDPDFRLRMEISEILRVIAADAKPAG
jgi:peroxiredoxin